MTQDNQITNTIELKPAEPLRKRVPTQDTDGTPLSDLMIFIPRLKNKPQRLIARRMKEIECVLANYKHAVVFAELNVSINILWISVRSIPGICINITSAIKSRVPEAVLVGHPGH